MMAVGVKFIPESIFNSGAGWLRMFVLLICSGISFADIGNEKCPGVYCGRTRIDSGLTDCGACPRGYQPDIESICQRCENSPTFYDWMYLGFMAMLSLALHWFFIDFTNKRKRSLIILHLCALLECVSAVVLTLLLVDPLGNLKLRSCPVERVSDWYTMLYNPSSNYTTTLHCTQEIVYPFYTVVMIYYAISLVFLMLMRPLVSWRFMECRGTKAIYAALYFLPTLIIVQAVFGGLLYYSFPYIMVVVSVITSATHMVYSQVTIAIINDDCQTIRDLLKENFKSVRNLEILIGHWILHAYGIVAMTEMKDPPFHGPLLALVPFPVFFYILTFKFTDPERLERVG